MIVVDADDEIRVRRAVQRGWMKQMSDVEWLLGEQGGVARRS